MLLNKVLNTTRATLGKRTYATQSNGSFYYKFGTPLVRCTVLASATTLAWQLLWQHLEYQEYRDESEAYVTKLEERLKSLEQRQ
jgi:hypothetical protein